MAASKASNPNYDKLRSETVRAVEETLRKVQASGRTYNTLAELLKDVAVFSGVARSTLRPYRNADAYQLIVKFYGALAVDPAQIPDEVADEFVLRIKLALLRADNAELARKLKARENAPKALVPAAGGEQTLMELYHAFAQFLLRSHGSLRVNERQARIEDKFPERGLDPVVASGEAIRQFAAWLRSHPTWSMRRDFFTHD